MATHRIATDLTVPLRDAGSGHNRWHPDIPPAAEVDPGDSLVVDVRDGLDVQVLPDSTTADLAGLDMHRGHPMAGPFFVRDAEPGDVLEVRIDSIAPADFGYTTIIPGFGLLEDAFTEPYLVKWSIDNGMARSPDIPGVAIPAAPFVGLVGVAPSHERLRAFTFREAELARRGGDVLPPSAVSAVPAQGTAAVAGLRTVPPRETGGNMDVKHVTAGSRVWLAVDVPGALVSIGDIHLSQGDGESCGVAIEVAGTIELTVNVHAGRWKPVCPVIETPSRHGDPPGPSVVTTGLPIDEHGRNRQLDVRLSARNALADMIAYLTTVRGLTREQSYIVCSVAVDLRISSIVNIPNSVVSAVLPLGIFEEAQHS